MNQKMNAEFIDRSSATPLEKARRVLHHLADPKSCVYFHEDGFPRALDIERDVKAVRAVLEGLAASGVAAPVAAIREASSYASAFNSGTTVVSLDDVLRILSAPSQPVAADAPAEVATCGHPVSTTLRSAETGERLYCEACDDKSGRRDAEMMEAELRIALIANEALHIQAIEELQQLGYTVKDGQLYPPAALAAPVEVQGVERGGMVITLCGSARFESMFKAWNEALTLCGHTVFSLSVYPSEKGRKDWYSDEVKRELDAAHLRKIAASDAVLVINRHAYIGESTMREIEHARKLGKEVYFLESWGKGKGVGDSHTSECRADCERFGLKLPTASPIDTFTHPTNTNLSAWENRLLGAAGSLRSAAVKIVGEASTALAGRPAPAAEAEPVDFLAEVIFSTRYVSMFVARRIAEAITTCPAAPLSEVREIVEAWERWRAAETALCCDEPTDADERAEALHRTAFAILMHSKRAALRPRPSNERG